MDERPEEINLKSYGDSTTLATAMKSLEVDIAFHLGIDDKAAVAAADGCTVKTFEVGYHYMMFHNMDATKGTVGALAEAGVREAIDLAVDRSALETVLPGAHGTRSLFPDVSPYYTEFGSMTADATAAGALLDTAGWTLDSTTGYRTKNGEVLSVKLVAYPFRAGLGLMQPSVLPGRTLHGEEEAVGNDRGEHRVFERRELHGGDAQHA